MATVKKCGETRRKEKYRQRKSKYEREKERVKELERQAVAEK